jgi:hypothetical protein
MCVILVTVGIIDFILTTHTIHPHDELNPLARHLLLNNKVAELLLLKAVSTGFVLAALFAIINHYRHYLFLSVVSLVINLTLIIWWSIHLWT